ncbi:MAG: nucleotidyl transferase AbiEii/AbiGii toxin family protein [Candidatus Omnitrophica bacterium]|jgi:predicted nucleotidyltransferase component of viral defense system|nr:nucleotidyl transferase AbiEii/AbiGii toxin family protein [Candidatus Omnitrophota bacterium]
MQDLIKQEQFELEVLDKLNTARLLNKLIFCGGTMLRLCYGLQRFSVDLDFWLARKVSHAKLFKELKDILSASYTIRDSANKFHTILFEIKSSRYPRALKIEVRKQARKVKADTAIAYSQYSNTQVFLKVLSLQDMMRNKAEAFLSRKEARDIFDMEFLFKKGILLGIPKKDIGKILSTLDALTKKDYQVKLGALLLPEQRAYYTKENFKILRMALEERISSI